MTSKQKKSDVLADIRKLINQHQIPKLDKRINNTFRIMKRAVKRGVKSDDVGLRDFEKIFKTFLKSIRSLMNTNNKQQQMSRFQKKLKTQLTNLCYQHMVCYSYNFLICFYCYIVRRYNDR